MSTWNPAVSAANEVRREAEEAGALELYVAEMVWQDMHGFCPSIQERRELVKRLVAEKERKAT